MRRRTFLLGITLACLSVPAARGQAIKELRGHSAPVYAIAFQPDGERMATASFDHTLKVWDVDSGRLVQTFTGHKAKVLALSYSPDGRQLASAGLDGTVRVWDAASGRVRACLTSLNQCVQGIAFTPDGHRLIACGETGVVEIWRTAEGSLERTISVEPAAMPLFAVAVSADGGLLAVAGLDGRIHLHDLATGQARHVLEGHADAVYSLAFAPDGGSLLSGSGDQTVRRWDLKTREQSACLDGHRGAVYQVGYSPDGRRLVSAGTDGEVILWDAGTGAALHRHRFPGKTLCAAFAPDGRHVGAGSEWSACYLLELPRHVRGQTRRASLLLLADDIDECAAVLDEVLADRAGPQDADDEVPRRRPVRPGNGNVDLLTEKTARADEADTRGRQVSAHQGVFALVLRSHLHRLDEIDAILLAAFDLSGGAAILANQLADGLLNAALLRLLLAHAVADRRGVVIASVPIRESGTGHGQHVFPERFGHARFAQQRADLTRENEPLALCLADDKLRDALKIRRDHGLKPSAREAPANKCSLR